MSGVNPQGCTVTPFKKPSPEEMGHDFLWRIHKAVPEFGDIGIFNRSHYEDVLIVRVHNLVPKDVWSKRYDQINEFEETLHDNNVKILKFFLHISKEEQKKRFQQRIDDPDRRWKISEADFAERKFWDDYTAAYEAALTKCSTDHCSVVRHTGEQEMVPESRRFSHHHGDPARHAHEIPRTHGGREEIEMEMNAGLEIS